LSPRSSGVPRLLAVGWWLHLKILSRSAFDGVLGILYPLFFATTVFFIYGQSTDPDKLVAAAVGASAMGVWSAVSTSAATTLQRERSQGTLELLVAAPRPFPLIIAPITLALATIGLYSFVATLLWGHVAFGIRLTITDPVAFVLSCMALATAIGLMGFLLAVVSVRYRSAWALGTALEFPVWLLCGFVIPLSLLPHWSHPLSWLLPPTWGIFALDDSVTGHAAWPDIALCLVLGLAYAAFGAALSSRLIESARSRATLALN
jgi:ABC-2 type transport system permease protein